MPTRVPSCSAMSAASSIGSTQIAISSFRRNEMTFHSRFGVYGENQKTLQWAKALGLRHARDGHCLRWLCTGSCRAELCQQGPHSWSWMDHVTGWIGEDGKRLLLCQPYVQDAEGLQSLIATANAFNL